MNIPESIDNNLKEKISLDSRVIAIIAANDYRYGFTPEHIAEIKRFLQVTDENMHNYQLGMTMRVTEEVSPEYAGRKCSVRTVSNEKLGLVNIKIKGTGGKIILMEKVPIGHLERIY